MIMDGGKKDLVVLVADKQMEQTILGLLGRSRALGIRPIEVTVFPHANKDGGCRTEGPELLRTLQRQYRHGLLIFDREGCGTTAEALQLEADLNVRLENCGWGDRAKTIVLDPELEAWVWSPSPVVDDILGWSGKLPNLRTWLVQQSFLVAGRQKPARPKEAMLAALKEVGKPPSAAIFRKLATQVSFRNCQDPAFGRFWTTLRTWFPQ